VSTSTDRPAEVATAAARYLDGWLDHQRRRPPVPGAQAAVRVGDQVAG
jgi:D-alanyl-D-alanine carboxypeptidase